MSKYVESACVHISEFLSGDKHYGKETFIVLQMYTGVL